MPRKERPLSKSMYQVRISAGVEGAIVDNIYFTSFSGINDKSESIKYADGRRQRLFKMIGSRDIEDIMLSVPYKPEEHKPLIKAWKLYNCQELQIEIQRVACGTSGATDEIPIGEPIILTGCIWVGFKGWEADRASNDASMLELTFTVDNWEDGNTN